MQVGVQAQEIERLQPAHASESLPTPGPRQPAPNRGSPLSRICIPLSPVFLPAFINP